MRRNEWKVRKTVISALAVVVFALSMFVAVLPVQAAPVDLGVFAYVFDSAYYASRYPDLAAAFGNDEAALLNHFMSSGMAEGRQASEEFNVEYYISQNPDLAAVFGEDLTSYYMHYMLCGKAEGRRGNGTGSGEISVPADPNQDTAPEVTNATVPAGVGATSEETQMAYEVLAIMNQIRRENGLNELSATQGLMNAAQLRAGETVSVFSHTRPDGTSCFTAFKQNGVNYYTAGENIAAGQQTAASVMDSWMNSPGHRANILNADFGHVGIGCKMSGDNFYGIYWTQCFTD